MDCVFLPWVAPSSHANGVVVNNGWNMSVINRIETKLNEAFEPVHINVIDESHKHAGHSGAPEGGESHFRVEVVSSHFDGLNRIARQRAIYSVLKQELETKVHALALRALTPNEYSPD